MDIYRLFVPRDKDCLLALTALRWGDSPVCPYCKSGDVKKYGSYNRDSLRVPRYLCNSCGKTFSVLTGTVFERHKLTLGEMFYIVKNMPHMSINEIASELNLDFDVVHRFATDVMAVAHGEISIEKLSVAIEIDEIYVNCGEKGKKGD